MLTVLFDWEYARYIGKSNVGLILQPVAKIVKILRLAVGILFPHTEHRIPFVNYNYELALRTPIKPLSQD